MANRGSYLRLGAASVRSYDCPILLFICPYMDSLRSAVAFVTTRTTMVAAGNGKSKRCHRTNKDREKQYRSENPANFPHVFFLRIARAGHSIREPTFPFIFSD